VPRLDLRDEVGGGLALAVGQDLPPDVLRHHCLGLQVHQDGADGRCLGALQLLAEEGSHGEATCEVRQGLGFEVWNLGFLAWGLGLGVLGIGFGVYGLGFRI